MMKLIIYSFPFLPVIYSLSLQLHSSSPVARPDSKLPELPISSPAFTSTLPQQSQCPQFSLGCPERPWRRLRGPQGGWQHRLNLVIVGQWWTGSQPAGGHGGTRESELWGRWGARSTAAWEEKRRKARLPLPLSKRIFQSSQWQQS